MREYDVANEMNKKLKSSGLTLHSAWLFINTVEFLKMYSDIEITEDVLEKIYEIVTHEDNSNITDSYQSTDETTEKIIDDLESEFDFKIDYYC